MQFAVSVALEIVFVLLYLSMDFGFDLPGDFGLSIGHAFMLAVAACVVWAYQFAYCFSRSQKVLLVFPVSTLVIFGVMVWRSAF